VVRLGLDDYTFDSGEGSGLDADAGAGSYEWPGLGEAGGGEGADGVELGLVDGVRSATDANDLDDAGSVEDADAAVGWIEVAEDVAREERRVYLGDAVRPATAGTVEGKILAETFVLENG
jgi:hypothetical protein